MLRRTVDETPRAKRPESWVVVLAIVCAAMATAEIISGSMLPLMAKGLDSTEGMVGQAVTATAIVAIITSLSIGRIAGNHDRRKLLIILTLFLVASNLGVALSPNVWSMLASRLLLGAAIGIIWGLIPAVVLRLAPAGQFARSFATVMIGVSIASIIGAPAAAFFGDILGWRVVYIAATALAVIALVLLMVAFPDLPARRGVLDRDLKGTLQLPGLIPGMLGIMLIFGGAQAFFGYLVPFLESITGLGASSVSVTLLFFGLCGLAGNLIAPKVIGKSIYAVMVAAPAAMAILLGSLLTIGHVVIPAVAIIMAWSFARAHIGVGANAWVAHEFTDHLEGAGGILVAVIQGAMMLGAILGGLLIDNVGAGAPPAAGAIFITIGALYWFIMLKPKPVIIDFDAGESRLAPLASPSDPPVVVKEELA